MAFMKDLKRSLELTEQPMHKQLKLNDEHIIKNNLVEQICKTLQIEFSKETLDTTFFDCYKNICTNIQVQTYFKKNIQSFNNLFQCLLDLTIFSIKNKNVKLSTSCLECVNSSLDFMLEMCRMISTRAKLEKIFFADLVYPLCVISKNDYHDINFRLNSCIRKLMFNKINKSKFKDSNEIDNILIFTNLKEKINYIDSETIKLYYNKIINVTKETHDIILIDYVFRKLTSCLTNNETKSFGIDVLLENIKDLTFDFKYEIQGSSLTSFLDHILQEILTKDILTQSDCNILKHIAEMNAVILENCNEAVLLRVLMDENSVSISVNLIKLLLNVSTYLKRETKFVVWLLNAIKESVKQKKCNLAVSEFLGPEFLTSFSKTINQIGPKQSYNILKTLMYFLKAEIIDQMNISYDNISIMLQTVTEILTTYFNSIDIQEYIRTEITGQKCIKTMSELQEMLHVLLGNCLDTKKNNIFLTSVLKLMYTFEYFMWVLYENYDYNYTIKFSFFTIDEKSWIKLKKRVKKYGDDDCKTIMYKYALLQIRARNNITYAEEFNNFSPNILKFLTSIIHENYALLQYLNNDQLMEFASQVLEDILTNDEMFEKWDKTFKNEMFENNAHFAAALISKICMDVKAKIKCESIKDVMEKLNFDNTFKYFITDSEDDLYTSITILSDKVLHTVSWKQMDEDDFNIIKNYLKVLDHMNNEFLSLKIKRIIFMLLYSICKTCKSNDEIVNCCSLIFSDLLYNNEKQFSKCIHPSFFFNELFKPYLYNELFLHVLKKKEFRKCLENYILDDSFKLDEISILFNCIEQAKPVCSDIKEKEGLRKLCTKVCNVILGKTKTPITNSYEVKALTLSLNENISVDNINENLNKLINDTIRQILNKYSTNLEINVKDKEEWLLLKSTADLAIEALQHKICMDTSDVLTFLYKIDMHIKLETSSLFEFFERCDYINYYDNMEKRLIKSLETSNKDLLMNYVLNWKDLIQANVGTHHELRIKYLTKALNYFLNYSFNNDLWEQILQLVQSVINTTKFQITGTIIDVCIIIMGKCLQKCEAEHCLQILQFCSDLFTHRTEFVKDKTSIILHIFENSVKYVIRESRITDEQNKPKIIFYLNAMEKVVIAFMKLKKDIGRSNVYVISNFINYYSEGFVQPYVKDSLQVCIGNMLSACDQYAIAFLRRCLSDAEQKIFDSFYKTYKIHYKFTGKI